MAALDGGVVRHAGDEARVASAEPMGADAGRLILSFEPRGSRFPTVDVDGILAVECRGVCSLLGRRPRIDREAAMLTRCRGGRMLANVRHTS